MFACAARRNRIGAVGPRASQRARFRSEPGSRHFPQAVPETRSTMTNETEGNFLRVARCGLQRLQWRRTSLRLAAATVAAIVSAAAPAALTSSSAPDFTLHSVAGPNLRLQEQRGQVVMLNFWATWCAPCRQELPLLNRLYEKYHASGFQLLGVNIDEDTRNAIGVSSRMGLQFPVLLDTEKKVSGLYQLKTMPSTVLIDRDGRVRYVHLGYRDGFEDTYEKQIKELLRE
jgi:peroxiredoxin